MRRRSEIILKHMQIKSLEKARRLAEALEIIEVECGIREVKITFEDFFICPWIDLEQLSESEMQKLTRDILKQLTN